MTFTIIHPSIRPHKWREIYEAWIAAAAHPENVEYILVADEKWGFVAPKPDDGREPEWAAQELHAWKEDVENAFRMTMDEACSGDQKHCTCVPLLKLEIKRIHDIINEDGAK